MRGRLAAWWRAAWWRDVRWRAVRAIARKDMKVAFQNKGVMIPLIVVPMLMLGGMPAMAAFAPALELAPGASMAELSAFIEQMPGGLRQALTGLDETQALVVLLLKYLMASMYLIVPLMVASVIAADSFAGEKERKTLEALLYTPTTDREILLGKMLGAWLPAVAIAWIGFVLYGVVANAAAWRTMCCLFFPDAMWMVLAIWVAPAVAGFGLGVTVLISARAKTFQEAYQLGGVVVVPMLVLVIGQATGVMLFNVGLVVLLGLAFWIADAALLWLGGRAFQRDQITTRL
jgi:ABC-type Na+ efflux pump permease subunit